jgi:hypothetical protein
LCRWFDSAPGHQETPRPPSGGFLFGKKKYIKTIKEKQVIKILICLIAGLLSALVFADTSPTSGIPQEAFFVGIGASQNKLNFNNQQTWGMGTTVSLSPPLSGDAQGGTGVNLPSQNKFAPAIQLGYFSRLKNSDLVWGAKFSYSYLGATSQVKNQLIPQVGGFINTSGNYETFTGNYVVRSYQQTVKNQISFTPFIGHAFSRSYLYAGAGPSMSQVKTNISGVTGFADVFGYPSDISGSLQTYSSTQWVVGGSAIVGGTYFLDDAWFMDLNYSYTQTKNSTANWAGPWSKRGIYSPGGFNDVTYTGTNAGTSSGNVATQALTLTLNRAF